jgi:hypothetical protein
MQRGTGSAMRPVVGTSRVWGLAFLSACRSSGLGCAGLEAGWRGNGGRGRGREGAEGVDVDYALYELSVEIAKCKARHTR